MKSRLKKSFILLLLGINAIAIAQSTQFMTYNIRYDNKQDTVNNWEDRKDPIVELIKHYSPAIIGTQEGLLHQLEYIDKQLENYKFIGVGRDDGMTQGEYCAILYDSTHFQVIESATFWLSETPEKPSKGWDAALNRICTYGLFKNKTTQKMLWVFNTHFDHVGEISRANSAQLILAEIHQHNMQDYPVVLMGDLNLTPDEKPIRELGKQLDDAQHISEQRNQGSEGTFNGFTNSAEKKIDYFFTQNLQVLSHRHLNEKRANGKQISDHFPVLISVRPNN